MAHEERKKTSDLPPVDAPGWNTVFLVCRKCSKRKHAPHGIKPKALYSTIRHSLPKEKPRPRVLFSSCLGLCPKGAMAVARVGAGEPRIVAVTTLKELEGALPALRAAHP